MTFNSPEQRRRFHLSRAFTLIEIMVAIGIMGVVLAMAMPAIYRTIRQDGIRKATSDIMEGCTQARAMAILQGSAAELVIRSDDGSIQVQSLPPESSGTGHEPSLDWTSNGEPPPARFTSKFGSSIPDSVAIQMLDVNFRDHMELGEAHVHFYSNGTSDEFTIVLRDEDGGMRKISLDVITGLPSMETIK